MLCTTWGEDFNPYVYHETYRLFSLFLRYNRGIVRSDMQFRGDTSGLVGYLDISRLSKDQAELFNDIDVHGGWTWGGPVRGAEGIYLGFDTGHWDSGYWTFDEGISELQGVVDEYYRRVSVEKEDKESLDDRQHG